MSGLPQQEVRNILSYSGTLLAKNPKEEGEEYADDDARGEGKEEGEALLLYVDVTRKAANVGDPVGKEQNEAGGGDDDTEDDEHLTEGGHMIKDP
jgi:hypothetical protein